MGRLPVFQQALRWSAPFCPMFSLTNTRKSTVPLGQWKTQAPHPEHSHPCSPSAFPPKPGHCHGDRREQPGLPGSGAGVTPARGVPSCGVRPEVRGPPTYVLVAADQELEDVVHGAHVEDEPQLRDAHGDQAEQQDGAEHAVHEGRRRCGGTARCSGQQAAPGARGRVNVRVLGRVAQGREGSWVSPLPLPGLSGLICKPGCGCRLPSGDEAAIAWGRTHRALGCRGPP